MNHTYTGHCECQSVQVKIELSHEIENYAPRACDCDYCLNYNAQYISDPKGKITITSKQKLKAHQQGSKQAYFHHCPQCQSLIAVTCECASGLKGALNAVYLDLYEEAQTAAAVSPKLLSAVDKKSRWDQIWTKIEIN